eukprot:TRINITY_DN463_c0_g1_i1.p1 TRINITY_DN463_c0_g1~~TRINITY_DN463_c0_g1_i1.p1  ORF type:complete len:100 (+),score=15.59 TRINITY_DN463_c0_g1_i1:429-728(+)
MAGETLVFRCGGFSPPLSLLMPTFSFVTNPAYLTVNLQLCYNAPLPILRCHSFGSMFMPCLLYTSDAADDLLCVDLGGRRIIKKKKKKRLYRDMMKKKI